MANVVVNQTHTSPSESANRGGALTRLFAFVLLLFAATTSWAASLTLAWDTSVGAVSYKVYYGTVSRTYTGNVSAGAATTATVSGLTAGQRYYFAVTATNAAGAESAYSTEVSGVVASIPVASFTANTTTGRGPLAVNFDSSSSNGSITSYAWTFGDGGTSTAANPSHTYATFGTYTVALTVSGSSGSNTQTRVGYIVVTRAPIRENPTATEPAMAAFFADATSGAAPVAVNFNSLSTGAVASYSWSFGDGATSTEANPRHTYTSAGIYSVALTVTGPGDSNTRVRSSYITVSPPGTPELTPLWSRVDANAPPRPGVTGNRNGLLEPGESVMVESVWRNDAKSAVSATGTASNFIGPAGATYTIHDRTASYGLIAPGAVTDCRLQRANCYRITVSDPQTRPAQHWDASLHETLSPGNVAAITVHIGHSFSDVPSSDAAYLSIETMLHNDIMSPFADGTFRPMASVTRVEAMTSIARAVTALARDLDLIPASGQVAGAPYACQAGGASLYADVAPTDEGCKEIHFLAAYGVNVTSGCTDASHACPTAASSPSTLAVLIAGAAAGGDADVPVSGTFSQSGSPRSYNCSAGGSSHFPDVSVATTYCRHVNYLWATGALDANADGSFGPASVATRAKLAQLITRGWDFTLN